MPAVSPRTAVLAGPTGCQGTETSSSGTLTRGGSDPASHATGAARVGHHVMPGLGVEDDGNVVGCPLLRSSDDAHAEPHASPTHARRAS